MVAIVIKLFVKVVGFVVVEVLEIKSSALSVTLVEEPSGEDWEELVSEE